MFAKPGGILGDLYTVATHTEITKNIQMYRVLVNFVQFDVYILQSFPNSIAEH